MTEDEYRLNHPGVLRLYDVTLDAMRDATRRPFGVSEFMSFVRATEVPLRQQQNPEGRGDRDLSHRERRAKDIGAAEAEKNSCSEAAQRVRASGERCRAK